MALRGMWMAVILAMLSFVGIEVIAVTSGETHNPQKAIPAALRTMAVRLFLFYFLALAVVAAVIPWTQTGGSVTVSESPFVKMSGPDRHSACRRDHEFRDHQRGALGHEHQCLSLFADAVLTFARRLCPALSGPAQQGRHARWRRPWCPAPAFLPRRELAKFTPNAYSYLQGIALFGTIIVWVLILVSHIGFRRAHRAAELPVRMPLFPAMQIAGLALC